MKKTQLLATERGPLDAVARFSEIIFGLIMALSFIGTISVVEHGHAEIRTLLAAALGCNIAWGIVDGVMYWITRMVERARTRAIGDAIRNATELSSAQAILRNALPDEVIPLVEDSDLQRMIDKIQRVHPTTRPPLMTWEDIRGAFFVSLLVILTTIPVSLPFILVSEVRLAMLVSRIIAIVSLFYLGVSLARFANQRKLVMGLFMVFIGAALVWITIQLGG